MPINQPLGVPDPLSLAEIRLSDALRFNSAIYGLQLPSTGFAVGVQDFGRLALTGRGFLVGGALTVPCGYAGQSSGPGGNIFVQRFGAPNTQFGELVVTNQTGTSFDILSMTPDGAPVQNGADNSGVQWLIVPPTFVYADLPQGVNNDGVRPISWDGASHLTRGAGLTGAADGPRGMLSCWFNIGALADGVAAMIMFAAGARVFLRRGINNRMQLLLDDAGGVNIANMLSVRDYTQTLNTGWHHLAASWDTTINRKQLFIDGQDSLVPHAALPALNVDYTVANWSIGATTVPAQFFTGCFAELYFNIFESLDLTLAANRLRFRTASGRPQWLGDAGILPTGNQPIMYHRMPFGAWQNNQGSGGNFAVASGALAACANGP